jgi:hypothetical protein
MLSTSSRHTLPDVRQCPDLYAAASIACEQGESIALTSAVDPVSLRSRPRPLLIGEGSDVSSSSRVTR